MYKYISASKAYQTYDMQGLMNAIEEGYKLLGNKKIAIGPRTFIKTRDGGDFLYGAAVNLETGNFIVSGSAFMPWFIGTERPNVTDFYMLQNFNDGDLKAVIEGKDIVTWRTGAKSGVAANYLAKKSSKILGLIGLGQQMKTQVEAISKVRNIEQIIAWTRNLEAHYDTVDYIKKVTGIEVVIESIENIMKQSDIVVVGTYSKEPLISFKDSTIGQLIISIAHSVEVSDDFVMNADKVFADYVETATNEFGPIKSAVEKGSKLEKFSGDLSEVVTSQKRGRKNEDEIILFQSLGVMHEDLSAVEYLYNKLSH